MDSLEQYLLSLTPAERELLVLRFLATDDLEKEFSMLVVRVGHYKPAAWEAVGVLGAVDELTDLQRGAGEGGSALAVLPSVKRKYDGNPATTAAAAAAWNSGSKQRPSGTQRRKAVENDQQRARWVVSDKGDVRAFYRNR